MSAWAMQFIVFEPCPNATTAGGATKQSAANAANVAASLKLSPVLRAINIAGPCPLEAKPKREWAPLQASPICTCHVCVATETVREARKKCELGPPL